MVVCMLCSCYPWPVLGLPPLWYKSAPYRSRAVADPRGVLKDMDVTLPPGTDIRVWDSTSEMRYLGAADASRRHRGLQRRATRQTGHARFHDRHRPAEVAPGCKMKFDFRHSGSREAAIRNPDASTETVAGFRVCDLRARPEMTWRKT
jgi:hypothetical protein